MTDTAIPGPNPRPRSRFRPVEVVGVRRLAPRLVSVALGGESLADFRIESPTQHIKVDGTIVRDPGGTLVYEARWYLTSTMCSAVPVGPPPSRSQAWQAYQNSRPSLDAPGPRRATT